MRVGQRQNARGRGPLHPGLQYECYKKFLSGFHVDGGGGASTAGRENAFHLSLVEEYWYSLFISI